MRFCMLTMAAGVGMALAISPIANASRQSSQLIDQGLAHLQKLEQPAALADFAQAARVDPSDAEAAFFLGVVHNRMGHADAALAALQRSKSLGGTNPDLAFEIGWSRLQRREWQPAVSELTTYQAAHPNDKPQANLFLARAYLALKDFSRAASALDRAIEQSPGDKEMRDAVEIEQFRLAAAKGDAKAADEKLRHVTELIARDWNASVGEEAARSFLPTLRPDRVLNAAARSTFIPELAAGRTWWGSLSLGGGYDTAARGRDPLLDTGVAPAYPTAFGDARGDIGYALYNTPDRAIWLEDKLFNRAYVRQSIQADLTDNELSANIEQRLAPSLRGALQIADDYTLVDYSNFRDELATSASLKWDVTPSFSTQVGYDYAHDAYTRQGPTTQFTVGKRTYSSTVFDRDAENHAVNLSVFWTVPRTSLQLRGGYIHSWNFSQGDQFDFQSNSAFVGLAVPLPGKFSVDLSYTYRLEKYGHPSVDPFVTGRRRDSIDSVTLALSRPFSARVDGYLQYSFNSDRSNVSFYAYSQHVVSTGVTIRF